MSAGSGRRRAGLLVPLFSLPSSGSWGIGEIADVAPMTTWLAAAGLRALQLLPINEMASGDHSPYSAQSAMAIDPIFIRVGTVPEFGALGGEAALDAQDRHDLDAVRRATRIDYVTVRRLKERALSAAFDRFLETEWRHGTERARALETFEAQESWWLHDYALFRALHAREGRTWTEWPDRLRRRDPRTLEAARRELAREILFRVYLQWIAATDWRAARASARANGVALLGDLPFMVDANSADVWTRQDEFSLERSVGVPPDAFSATGQDWGMPAYRWDVVAAGGFEWLRDRGRRSAAIYDGFRVDHLVGFYRTYSRPRRGGPPAFEPSTEAEQLTLGEHTLGIFRDSGAEIIAEDLGIVPGFVRASLERLGVPGFRVFRWERHWETVGHAFRDPSSYPAISVAASGTHDTEPMIDWWDHAPEAERAAVANVASLKAIASGIDLARAPYNPVVRDVLLETLFASRSELLLLPIQDVFGWRDRVNQPATVTPENWTFRLPWPCDRIDDADDARERQAMLRTWAARYNRL
jgi:4-alpha-glucanotransferase